MDMQAPAIAQISSKGVTAMVIKKFMFVLPLLVFLNGCTTEYGIKTPMYNDLYFPPYSDKQNLIFEFSRYYGYPFTCCHIIIRSHIPHQKLRIHEVSFIWKNKKKFIIKNLNLKLSMNYKAYTPDSFYYWDDFDFSQKRIHVYTTALFGGLGMKKPGRATKQYGISDEMAIPVTIVYSYEDGILRTETDTFTVQCRKRDAIELPWFLVALSG
jgi:hypothetical protein